MTYNCYVGSLFLDVSKTLDLLDHTILIQKLSLYGLHNSATDWFNSYLRPTLYFNHITPSILLIDTTVTRVSSIQRGIMCMKHLNIGKRFMEVMEPY